MSEPKSYPICEACDEEILLQEVTFHSKYWHVTCFLSTRYNLTRFNCCDCGASLKFKKLVANRDKTQFICIQCAQRPWARINM